MANNKKQPAWKASQQKQTGATNQESRATEAKKHAPKKVKILMKSDYMDQAKTGDTWSTDEEKAAELVRLGRAEYLSRGGDDEVVDDNKTTEGEKLEDLTPETAEQPKKEDATQTATPDSGEKGTTEEQKA